MTNSTTRIVAISVAMLILTLPLDGCASGPSWKEEVSMFDGSKVDIDRQLIQGNVLDQEFSDVRHGPPVKGNILRVHLSTGKLTSEWEAVGLIPLALGRVDSAWYLAAKPIGCGAYDTWGRPVPPYVFFAYSMDAWKRITVEEFPPQISKQNLSYPGSHDHSSAAARGYISAEQVQRLNHRLPDYVKKIYRNRPIWEWDDCRRRLEVMDRNKESKATDKRR